MEKIIYHGSDHIIEKPKFGYGKPYNDYGVGFYCTENPNMAKEWGVGIDHNGYANQYRIECDGLTILDLNTPDYTMLHWLTILLENREFDASAKAGNRHAHFQNAVIDTSVCYILRMPYLVQCQIRGDDQRPFTPIATVDDIVNLF